MKRPTLKDCWPLGLYIVGAIGILIALSACHSGGGMFGFLGSEGPRRSSGSALHPDVGTLNWMALLAFMPGLLMLGAGAFVKIEALQKIGTTFIIVGLGTAILAIVLKAYMLWLLLGLGLASATVFVTWFLGHRKRIMQGDIT